MRLSTRNNHTLDGQLLLVSRDATRAMIADAIAPNMITLLQNWAELQPRLNALAAQLERGEGDHFAFEPNTCAAPLPRSPQWCDASAFLSHQRLMAQAFNTPLIPNFETIPVLYQGASDDFLGPHVDVPMVDEALGIDFEGEFGVIVDAVPMSITPQAALSHIRLIVQLNDWSLRGLGAQEVKTGFGFIQAKPSTSFAPIAVTPDELGPAWQDGRVHMKLHVEWNGQWFGHADGAAMKFHFGELIAYAARTRKLSAGTIIGSGTVSNDDRSVGSSCIAERRVIEIIDKGSAQTAFMKFGDSVRMQARSYDDVSAPFGVIDQKVVK